ncbi:MAG TPA: ABC transporter ATP-binding protein [Nocardioides sp.]|nr:ABC transporter ATP-binding protein [Nocardioides sp.]
MLKVTDLVSGYGKVPALHGVDIEVGSGELVAIIGSNGSGKSTLLRTVSGLNKVMSGSIEFDGEPITNGRPDKIVRRGLVHCPEGRHVFPQLSAYENLRLGAHTGSEFDARLDEVYTLFPRIKERARQLAGSMSGGEQQMLAIGRSLMSDPTLVMLDEPSLGLAPIVVEQVLATAATIRDSGRTVLLVEQNAELALEVADRAYVLERGQILTHGPAAEIAQSPSVQKAYLAG